MTAYPAVQFLEDSLYTRIAEVNNPAPKLRSQHGNNGPDGATSARSEQHLEFGLEPLYRLAGHFQTHVIEVDPIFWTGSLGVIFTRFLPVGSILGDAPL